MVKWNLNEGTAGGGNYTLQFGWMSSLEDIKFTINRSANARIFHLTPDTMEAGTGPYTSYFTTLQPYHIARAGITTLGWFAVGKFSDSVTSVDHSISGLPKRFALNQNYPNPFNPTTVIGYQLPVTSRLSLRVYNVLGQEVTTLFEGSLGPGNYTATFDGNRLASGVYYVKIDASPQDKGTPYAKTIRMLLLK
jgi:hypothetical protein